ncbi:MAG: methyltransferase [Alphaproteobacteria bacterium]|nr:MAG: methyltransferase [Alphaproteobacteria bacterium]
MKYPTPLATWFEQISQSVQSGTFARISLAKPTRQADDLKTVDIRPITVKRQLKLSFTYHYKTRDIVKNYSTEESFPILAKLLGPTFVSARLYTLTADHILNVKGKEFTPFTQPAIYKQAPSLNHDRAKNRLIEGSDKPWLHSLGITDASGEVLKSAQDKFRQINKYVEVLDGLLRQTPRESWKIADMGSGKGYLTFALYQHLTATMGLQAQVVGVEVRADMVKLGNDIARQNGFSGLSFVQGTIADYDCSGTNLVIALHACDTATDDALAKAVKAGAQLIVASPCCHKQIRKQLNVPAPSNPLHPMLKFGTYAERMAEMITDTLRTQVLEAHGYTTNLFEFVDTEHTPKNVLITAIKNETPHTAEYAAKLQAAIQTTKQHFGLKKQALEDLLA